MRNPVARKPKSPIDQALDLADNVRADAAEIAGTVRDAAARAADVLGEAAPSVPRERRLIIVGVVAAAALAVAYVIRNRAGEGPGAEAAAPAVPYTPPSVETAAANTAPPVSTEAKPAAEVDAEKPQEPKAETAESEEAAS